ncbi:hypothetical protein [Alloactinosynnema sp. L-07]|uniref:hypothetical protein n=1 Tax=Alloactinosynnema sp. L-07 TaxID=1653480 RepID=UPI0012FA5B8C|nr:hypothetical protein [Alloactinosynnema sp. L-07]
MRKAKRHASAIMHDSGPHHWATVLTCANILETRGPRAVFTLRRFWQASDPAARAIIAACAPQQGDPERRSPAPAIPEPRWTARTRYQAPRDIRTEIRPDARRRRDPDAARRQGRAHAVTDTYIRERGGVDDQPDPTERPIAYALDYDRAALPALRGLPCLHCFVELSEIADHERRDGLCFECHDRGRPGITTPTTNAAELLIARCAYIAEHYHRTAALTLLRREWNQVRDRHARTTITEWVTANAAAIAAPARSAQHELPPPCDCGSIRQVRDGLCVDCRQLDSSPVQVAA